MSVLGRVGDEVVVLIVVVGGAVLVVVGGIGMEEVVMARLLVVVAEDVMVLVVIVLIVVSVVVVESVVGIMVGEYGIIGVGRSNALFEGVRTVGLVRLVCRVVFVLGTIRRVYWEGWFDVWI